MKKKSSVVPAFTPEALIKRKVRAHLRKLGFDKSNDGSLRPPSESKDTVRALHADQRKAGLNANRAFVQGAFPRLKKHLAEGKDIDPQKIAPELELIDAGTWQSELFRLASLSWSVPVSNGFGRRLRYLVWDISDKTLSACARLRATSSRGASLLLGEGGTVPVMRISSDQALYPCMRATKS